MENSGKSIQYLTLILCVGALIASYQNTRSIEALKDEQARIVEMLEAGEVVDEEEVQVLDTMVQSVTEKKSFLERLLSGVPTARNNELHNRPVAMEAHVECHLAGRFPDGPAPLPDYAGSEKGIVLVNVSVDDHGNVTDASFNEHSSISDPLVLASALNAALATRFTYTVSSPTSQEGLITYTFERKRR